MTNSKTSRGWKLELEVTADEVTSPGVECGKFLLCCYPFTTGVQSMSMWVFQQVCLLKQIWVKIELRSKCVPA